MFNPFSRPRTKSKKQVAKPLSRLAIKPYISLKERHRIADTDGMRRRLLQLKEDNRLL